MTELTFNISWEHSTADDPLEAAAFGNLVIRLADVPITLVQDCEARTTREDIRVSAYPLALWFASNWWRLRFEGPRESSDWKLSHQLGAAGGGYVWPHVTFVSDGESIHITVQRRPRRQWEPVIFLNEVHGAVSARHFESQVEGFIRAVEARLMETGYGNNELNELWSTVQLERRSAPGYASRRLEALLGFDAEEAPVDLLAAYTRGAETFGEEAVAELAAAASNGAAPDWEALSRSLNHGSAVRITNFLRLKENAQRAAETGPTPWQRGEAAARAVRQVLAQPTGVLTNDLLREWLGADVATPGDPCALAIAHRESSEDPDIRICFRSGYPNGRRFELARLLGDHLVAASTGDSLLPATRAKTARQSVQRAFAAELLLPWDDLNDRVGDDPDDESMEATAREFEVSPLVVRTRLVNKRRLSADALEADWNP